MHGLIMVPWLFRHSEFVMHELRFCLTTFQVNFCNTVVAQFHHHSTSSFCAFILFCTFGICSIKAERKMLMNLTPPPPSLSPVVANLTEEKSCLISNVHDDAMREKKCMCVCSREREREIERKRVCVWLCVFESMCVRQRENETVS